MIKTEALKKLWEENAYLEFKKKNNMSHRQISAGSSKRHTGDQHNDSPLKKGKFADIFQKRVVKDESSVKEHTNDPLFWGPYLAERQWGTVREDYSSDGSCWQYLTHNESMKQAYNWGEDGLLGISDKFGLLCGSLALWNGKDPILKERLFGLNGDEGNHGEDVKELYYYLDNTPKHNYMQALYRYPQETFPYDDLVHHDRTFKEPELELIDTGVFDGHDYWDITVEYAKPAPHTLICKITLFNHSASPAKIDVIPQFFFRNTWSKPPPGKCHTVPLFQGVAKDGVDAVYDMGIFRINFLNGSNATLNELLFTNNNSVATDVETKLTELDPTSAAAKSVAASTSKEKHLLRSSSSATRPHSKRSAEKLKNANGEKYQKDAFHKRIVQKNKKAVNSDQFGTKVGAWMTVELSGNTQTSIYWQLFPADVIGESNPQKLDSIIATQKKKADDFYKKVIPAQATKEEFNICRQAIAGLFWSKQFYIYNVELKNTELKHLHDKYYFHSHSGSKRMGWNHLSCHDILLMPDKWEFPWFAAWDLAFHCVQIARFDMAFAKEQILLLMSDRYMHPSGQVPGCEFDLGDTNPPIVAWATWKIFQLDNGKDLPFLKTCFNRLIFSFQWWNRLDPYSTYLYGNGFMGLDNICIFDRSHLPKEMTCLKQADCTGWMGLFALTMLKIALELCKADNSYTDMAIKFLRHFLHIAQAINRSFSDRGLWDDEDKFFYDVAYYQEPHSTPIRLRSWSSLVPLLACWSIDLKHSPLVQTFLMKCDRSFSPFVCKLNDHEFFLTLVSYAKLNIMLKTVFSEEEFLSPFGIRSLSKIYETNPFCFEIAGETKTLNYQPGESDIDMFGGNSNWRGPIWLCMNYLFVECLEKYSDLDRVFTLPLSLHYPTGAAKKSTFVKIAEDICKRIIKIFLPDELGLRPLHGDQVKYSQDSDWQNLVLFYEYFHAETGRGCGASHQTGWTALVYEFICKLHAFQDKS